MVKLVVDSTADIPPALSEEYGITVVPLTVQFGKETLRDGVDITRDEFYMRLAQQSAPPKTSQPSVGAFEQVYRHLSRNGDDILSIHLSGKFSGTVRAAQQAADLVSDARITVIDTPQVAMGVGFMAIAAARAAREGKSLAEIEALVKSMFPRVFLYVGLDTLRYLQLGGRIGRVQAFLGTMLSVKPLLEVQNGEPHPLEQVRTSKRMFARMLELVEAQGELEDLAVLYTAGTEQAQALADQIVERGLFSRERLVIAQMGAVIGTHVGPGGIAVNGIRKA